jgi:uncharacterized protein (TIRG00374 family)
MEFNRRHAVAGVLVWVAVFVLFVALAGPRDFVDAVTAISQPRFAAMMALNALGTVCMGLTLYVVARGAGLTVSPVESIFLNATVSLMKRFTPLGQASGVPAGGAIISWWTKQPFERSVAAMSMKEVVAFVPGILVFLFGGTYIVFTDKPVPTRLRSLAAIFSLGVAGFVIAVVLVYRNPAAAREAIYRAVSSLNRGIAQVPRVPELDATEIQDRVDGFSESVEQIASNRWTVTVACALATTAVLTQGALLWVALAGVGVETALAVTIFVVPVSLLASAVPLPGGGGGIEGTQVLLLLAMVDGHEAQIVTAVAVSRGLVFWTPVIVGALTLTGIQVRRSLAHA